MFSTVRLFIKTAVIFLIAGLALGIFMLFQRELYNQWPNPYLVSAHAHVVLVGFVMFLILGVALWLFPRAAKDDTRYSPSLIKLSYIVLSASTSVRFVAEASRAYSGERWLAWAVLAGGCGQVIGFAVYGWTMWGRIRPVGSHAREAMGERF